MRRAIGRSGTALALAALAAAAGSGPVAAQALPDTVRIEAAALHPEGVEWDAARGRFLVTSVTRGSVTAVRDDGSHVTLAEGPEGLGAIGVHLDAERDRVLAAHADVSVFQDTASAGAAVLGIYDAETGERLRTVDLAPLHPEGRHLANDVTVGPDGTAYVTDTFSPVLYAVPVDGEPSVLVRHESLGGNGFGTNGIDYHPDGYLIVAMPGRRTFVRVPIDDPAADGIVLREDGMLVAVVWPTSADEGSGSDVVVLRSGDGWRSAEVAVRATAGGAPGGGATTATLRDGAVYVVNPRFDAMDGEEPARVFRIYRVDAEAP